IRRVLGTAHASLCLHACAGRKIRRPAKNRATRAPAIKNGRYGSSNVRFPIHAPLKPRATKTRGPRQQVDARMAAKPPTRSAPEPVWSEPLLAVSTLTWHSPVCCCLFSQNWAMSVLLAQLSVATAQSQSQLVLQLVKVVKFPLNIGQLFLQPTLHRRTRLQPIPSQPQEPSDLAEFESQPLHAPYEGQRLDIVFAVPPEASLCSGRSRQQTVALVKANRVHAEPNLLRDDAYLHDSGSYLEATPWSIVQSQDLLFRPGNLIAGKSSRSQGQSRVIRSQ